MDLDFIKSAQQSPEIAELVTQMRTVSTLPRTHPDRVETVTNAAFLWVALADALEGAERVPFGLTLFEIVQSCAHACAAASTEDGAEPLLQCSDHLQAFIDFPVD
jgi:hypothetical protein